MPPRLDLRLRVSSAELIGLPWLEPLGEWDATAVSFRDVPVGPSRHLVRFVEADGRLWALKELPRQIALKEYAALNGLEDRSLPAVRAAGVVVQPFEDTAILVTHYLERSWQYRRLLMRIPTSMREHRARLFDAIAVLLVDLHRNGVYWGDCSLANTLFMRDGQAIQAWMVDAETTEIHPSLSNGQRQSDLEILVENILGGLLDVAARLGEPPELFDQFAEEAEGVASRYEVLWAILHDEPVISLRDHYEVGDRLRRLNDLGFAVDEVRLEEAEEGVERLRLKVAVGDRTFHTAQLRALTGLDVGEGQAIVLLNDLRAHQSRWQLELDGVDDHGAARRWLDDVFGPGVRRAHRARQGVGDPTQAYCDLLDVWWLLSQDAGFDVGEEASLEALAARAYPPASAVNIGIVDVATRELPAMTRDLMESLARQDEEET